MAGEGGCLIPPLPSAGCEFESRGQLEPWFPREAPSPHFFGLRPSCTRYAGGVDDVSFIEAFESGALPNSGFHHRDHVRLTWLYLRRDGPDLGAEHVLDGIRRFASAHGAAHLFHVTLTRFWIRLVQHLIEAFPSVDRFEDLLAVFPLVADKTIIYATTPRPCSGRPKRVACGSSRTCCRSPGALRGGRRFVPGRSPHDPEVTGEVGCGWASTVRRG